MKTFEEIKADIREATNKNDAEALLRHAAELDGIGTPQAAAAASSSRAAAHRLRGDHSAALDHYHRMLVLYEELGNRSGVAAATNNIGIIHKNTGNYHAALEHFQRALALHGELGERNSVAGTLCNIGNVHMHTSDHPAALEHFHRALAICEELGDKHVAANTLGGIGIVYKNTGDYPAALEYYHRALALHEALGNRIGMAVITNSIGNVYISTGDHSAALEHFRRALTVYEELGNRSGAALATGNIGTVCITTGDYPAALEHYHRALTLHEELGERSNGASVMSNILGAYVTMGSDAEAQSHLQAMDAMQIDDPAVRISRELHRATLQERSGDLDGAIVTLQRTLAEAQECGLLARVADAHSVLRDLALKQNNLAAYVEHNNEYTRITEEINGKDATLKMAMQAKQREIDARDREHQKHLAVLHSTLPKEVADRVARGEVVNDHYDNATVIFLDIVGFTEIASTMSSQDVITLLDELFTQCDTICANHGVTKIKTIGDSYMCVSFNDVTNAALCAIDMSRIRFSHSVSHNVSHEVEFRIGIHCGPVTAGVIGKERMQYDVWGDTVNVASRMESTGEPGRVHVSEAFTLTLEESLVTRHSSLVTQLRGSIDIKGKGPMQTYWLEHA
jgi:adenylate cyclase